MAWILWTPVSCEVMLQIPKSPGWYCTTLSLYRWAQCQGNVCFSPGKVGSIHLILQVRLSESQLSVWGVPHLGWASGLRCLPTSLLPLLKMNICKMFKQWMVILTIDYVSLFLWGIKESKNRILRILQRSLFWCFGKVTKKPSDASSNGHVLWNRIDANPWSIQ